MSEVDTAPQRLVETMIPQLAEELGAQCHAFSDSWVYQLSRKGIQGDICGYRFGLNNAAAASIARDKVATSIILNNAAIPAVPHILLRNTATGMAKYGEVQGEVVIKPLDGASGIDVRKLASQIDAEQYIVTTNHVDWAISPYCKIAVETRMIIVDGTILLTYEKHQGQQSELTMFNLGFGAVPVDINPTDELRKLAFDAAEALHLRLAAVDVVTLINGTQMVLEVNDGIMMEHYMRHSEDNLKRGREVYRQIIDALLT